MMVVWCPACNGVFVVGEVDRMECLAVVVVEVLAGTKRVVSLYPFCLVSVMRMWNDVAMLCGGSDTLVCCKVCLPR